MHKNEFEGALILFACSLLWGATFIFQSQASVFIDAYTLSAFRNIVGAIFLLPFTLISVKRNERTTKTKFKWKTAVIGGIFCGLCYTTASIFQQIGIADTSTGKAAFITALYIVLVPLFGLFLHKKVGLNIYISIAIALVGLALLCFKGSFSIALEDLFLILGALFFTFQILLVDHYSPKTNGIALCFFQLLTAAIISTILMLSIHIPSIESIINAGISILFCGIFSSGIAYTLQIIGQKKVSSSIASLIMSLESVNSAVLGSIIYIFYQWTEVNQLLNTQEIIGCVVMFLAVILSLIPPEKFKLFSNKKIEKDNLETK